MTRPMVVEKTPAEHLADVMLAMSAEVATARDAALRAQQDEQYERGRHNETRATLTRDRDRYKDDADRARTKAANLQRKVDAFEEAEPRHLKNLGQLDRMMLDLYHLIVELSGHRDTAKTKAERIALGHVVEQLKLIRGWDDAAETPEQGEAE